MYIKVCPTRYAQQYAQLIFNTPQTNNTATYLYSFTSFSFPQYPFPLNTSNSIPFFNKHFYILLIWNIFAKETSKY
nr:MAG TPA: hypothetical protein [Caudoviricetes sp.]